MSYLSKTHQVIDLEALKVNSCPSENFEQPLTSVIELVTHECPNLPLCCVQPATIISVCRRFMSKFCGDVLYALKCNTEPLVLNAIWASGIRHFDCASLKEVQLVRTQFPSAFIHFLHPIKSEQDITEAYFRWGVRTFAFDSMEELKKIIRATSDKNGHGHAHDLTLLLRLALPTDECKQYSVYPLSGKFGIEELDEAASLLKLARDQAQYLGVCFHVGSQCIDPNGYGQALLHVSQVIKLAGVPLEIVDVGGGFSVSYPDMIPPHLDLYMANIKQGFENLPSELVSKARIWCEPGRALVAAGCSLVVRVEARRSMRNILHINDGIYGNLSEIGVRRQWKFPYRLLRDSTADLIPFAFFGPTCDNADYMPGPFLLPSDIHTGDYIEIGQFGAYNTEIRTPFNGFDRTLVVQVRDSPMMVTPGLDDEEDSKAD